MYNSDIIRKEQISTALENPVSGLRRFKLNQLISDDNSIYVIAHKNGVVRYYELLNDSFWRGLYRKTENEGLGNSDAIKNFINNRLVKIGEELNLTIEHCEYDDGILTVYFYKSDSDTHLEELFSSVDEEQFLNVMYEDSDDNVNKRSDTQYNPDSTANKLKDKRMRHQNTRRVDMLLKRVFTDKFENNYYLKTDVGNWKAIKKAATSSKLNIIWEHTKESAYKIETLFFPNDTNLVVITVFDNKGNKKIKSREIDIFKIPKYEEEVENFFRKTFFNELKKYIDTEVIKLPPFREKFVFWDAENPDFPYSFSTPSRNKIVLQLIKFINTAQKPTLDDFFTQNNLKHKQGYLQTLLDAAEDADIFQFKRDGNEVLISKGPNYKAFLKGHIRKV